MKSFGMFVGNSVKGPNDRFPYPSWHHPTVWYTPTWKGPHLRAQRGSITTGMEVLVRANALELSVHRFINFWNTLSTISDDFWVEHEFFCSYTVTCQKLGGCVVQGRGGNWTTWKQLEVVWHFRLKCQKPATKYKNADIKGILVWNPYLSYCGSGLTKSLFPSK